MSDVLLTKTQLRQIRRLRFDAELEREFQEFAARERIGRIRVVVVLVFLMMAMPRPPEISSTPQMVLVGNITFGLTFLIGILVFIPKLRRLAVYALPGWDLFQQVAFGSAAPDPKPFMQVAIQLALSIVIVSAVRLPALLSLAFATITVILKVQSWESRHFPASEVAGPAMFLVFGLFFLVVGSYLTEIADRKSFLVSQLLEIERERTHSLLTNVLPAEIAEKLKDSSEAIATSHESISVLFADIVNFTPFAAQRPAAEVVGFLNDLFTRFDALVEKSGLEKIKTVGDAYMIAGGLPTFRADHLAAMADLALEMRGAAAAAGAAVRFGMHTGPAVAGVLGTRRYMYDIWGATVNLAARLETASRAGEILVSEDVREALSTTHEFEERDPVELKGVGLTRVFILLRRHTLPIEID